VQGGGSGCRLLMTTVGSAPTTGFVGAVLWARVHMYTIVFLFPCQLQRWFARHMLRLGRRRLQLLLLLLTAARGRRRSHGAFCSRAIGHDATCVWHGRDCRVPVIHPMHMHPAAAISRSPRRPKPRARLTIHCARSLPSPMRTASHQQHGLRNPLVCTQLSLCLCVARLLRMPALARRTKRFNSACGKENAPAARSGTQGPVRARNESKTQEEA
jgi:hypothetical protein